MRLIELFKEGGATMWLVLLVGTTATALAIAAVVVAFARKRGAAIALGAIALCAGLLTSAAGVGSYLWAMHRAFAAVDAVAPEYKARLLAQGISEAANNIVLGMILSGLPVLAGFVALVRGLLLPPAPAAAASAARDPSTTGA
jgi:hypothetical protein